MITKADKGNSTVIPYLKVYEQKVLEFISKSEADLSDHNITYRFQKGLRNTLNECKVLIGTENRGKIINLHPEPPSLRGLNKVHKVNTPIRQVVNFRNVPSYKLAKMLETC